MKQPPLAAIFAAFALAVVSTCALSVCKVPAETTAVLTTSITGFGALLVGQYRLTVQTETKLEEIEQTGKDTHRLVNSEHGRALHETAVALRRLAMLSGNGKDASDADAAEAISRAHDLAAAEAEHRK